MMIASASQQEMALEVKNSREKCGICCIPVAARGVLDCCSDIFCFGCIDTWSAFTNLCPLCKLQFKFITFVPVANDEDATDNETQEAFFDFLGQDRVDDWVDDIEEDGTLSFPSFFIDEDAVVCLDGDGCRVRKGLNEKDGELGLEDISVACDSCDCWYHASCVGYNPHSQEERSWICPRCVGTGVLDLFKFQLASKNLASKLSSKSLSADKDGSFTFVDEGETAVVVSMDASFDSALGRAADSNVSVKSPRLEIENSLDEQCVETAVSLEKIFVGSSVGLTESLSKDASSVVTDVSGPQPVANAFEVVDHQKGVAIDTLSMGANLLQQALDRCPLRPGAEAECSVADVPLNTSQEIIEETKESSFVPPIKDESNNGSMTVVVVQPPIQVSEEDVSKHVGNALESMDVKCKSETDKAEETRKLKQHLVSAKQQNKVSKRREPPQSPPKKQEREKKKFKPEDRGPLSSKSSKTQAEELQQNSCGSMPIEAAQKRKPVKQPIKEELIERNIDDFDSCTLSNLDAISMQEVLKPKSEVMNELTELVQGPTPCPKRVVLPRVNTNSATTGTSEGVRTRKIVYRGSVLDENMSKIVNEMRLNLKREAAALGIVGDDKKVDVTDEKFFVAFKAAIQSSQASLRQLAPAKRMSLQRQGAKLDGSRQNLMKKLYGGSGKRRQAWDRDWDISFWRDRVTREKNSKESSKTLLQQEMAHMEEALQDSKKASKAELDSLKSRVYLADTSLLPRQKDVKPLSEQSTLKTASAPVRQSKPSDHVKMAEGAPKRATASEVSKPGAFDNNQPIKTDKQKWALEVLARKTRQSKKPQKNRGSLLAELPGHMRPVLEYDRRSKVPTATRQIQLDRFIEHYLQQARIESVGDNPECQAALTAAMNKEKEIYDRSNSKSVYVNLCVQALGSLPNFDTTRAGETSPDRAVENSSRAAADFPTVEAAGTSDNEDLDILMAWKAAGLVSDSPPGSPACVGQETYTSGMGSGPIDIDCQDGTSKSISDVANSSPAGNSNSIEKNSDPIDTEAGRDELHSNGMEDVLDEEACIQSISRNSGRNTLVENVQEKGELDVGKVVADRGQEYHASLKDAPGQEENLQETELCSTMADISVQEQPIDMPHKSATDVSAEMVPHSNEWVDVISKQVESYVKDHIRPLHRSRIITTEQYKWAVVKTTNKVMQHHSQAESADFLIAEGEKVRRLAEQYLQLYSEHIFPGVG